MIAGVCVWSKHQGLIIQVSSVWPSHKITTGPVWPENVWSVLFYNLIQWFIMLFYRICDKKCTFVLEFTCVFVSWRIWLCVFKLVLASHLSVEEIFCPLTVPVFLSLCAKHNAILMSTLFDETRLGFLSNKVEVYELDKMRVRSHSEWSHLI